MSTHVLRSLNEVGIERFREFLIGARGGDTVPAPRDLCSSVATSEEILPTVVVDPDLTFSTRLQFGQYLESALEPLWRVRQIDNSRGVWTSLAVLYFDVVCPIVASVRKIKNEDRYILLSSWNRMDRHLVRTPFVLTRLHGLNARAALSGPPHIFSEAVSQLTNRQQVLTNVSLFKAVDRLYVKSDGKLKTGASSQGPGSLRRLAKVLRQFDLTYDLHSMDVADILGLLP